MNESILVVQERYYGPDKKGPPMLPHGDDPCAVHPPTKRQKKKRKKKETPPPLPKSNDKEFLDPLVASTLPSGFPEELAFRALAAYSLLRTLSTQLALSPFAPTAFLRALYLPIPSNLIGRVHVTLLRKLLMHLKMGYHFGEKNQPLLVAKKRKIDGISWQLRAGDNLQLLDSISWPVFYDDYCHLTADILYQSMNDETLYHDHRNIGPVREELSDELEKCMKQPIPAHHGPAVLYLDDENDVESDDESFVKEDDSDGSYDGNAVWGGKRTKKKSSIHKRRPRKRKSEVISASQPSMHRVDHVVSSQYTHGREAQVYYPTIFAQPLYTDVTTLIYGNGQPPASYTSSTVQSVERSEEQLFANAERTFSENSSIRVEPLAIEPTVSFSQPPRKPLSHVEPLVVKIPENERHVQFQSNCTFSKTEPSVKTTKQEMPLFGTSFKEPSVSWGEYSCYDRTSKVPEESTQDANTVLTDIDGEEAAAGLKSTLDIKHVVQQFMRGELDSSDGALDDSGDHVEVDQDCVNPSTSVLPDDEEAAWSHFRPLRRLRQGIPYHKLSLLNKLTILEFLIDELLMVDEISAEMTTRNHNTSCYPVPFGQLPSPMELENMNNDDWCSVCKQEGDLICCDGCISSYHRECSGLPKSGPLPEGKWFCPECALVDPAMLGPLNGGRKSSIGWADGHTLDLCARNYNDFRNHANVGYAMLQPNLYGPLESNQQVEDGRDSEYLCVHGFLFCKTKGEIPLKPPSPLPGNHVISHLSKLGFEVCSSWPLVQIPVSEPIFRDVNVLPASSGSKYIASFENYNPCLYANKYSPTPDTGNSDAVEYEGRWHHAFSFQLWDCLRPDTSSDHLVKDALMTGTSLFDPLEIIRRFMIDLEAKLFKAALLDSKWGAVVPTDTSLKWRTATQQCKSLLTLAKLFVKLIDAVHPLAFDLSWFNCSRTKTTWQENSLTHSQSKTVQFDTGTDASMMAVVRCWQTCPVASIHCLLARESYCLMDWIRESDPELGLSIRKKGRKRDMKCILKAQDKKGHGDDMDTSTEITGHEAHDHDPVDSDGPRVKRLRSSRYSFASIRNPDTTSGAASAKTFSALPRKMKFEEIRTDLSGSLILEPLWPICGRQPFPAYGSFPGGVTRYLARNAGGVAAPFVTYSNDFEVGQVANSHVWRKRMFECKSFEEFLLLASSLETYIENSTIRRATTFAQRYNSGKNNPSSIIIESYRDLRTGLMEHLVSKHKQSTATWVSTPFVDLPVIIHCQMEKSRLSKQVTEELKAKTTPSIDSKPQSAQRPTEQTKARQRKSGTKSAKTAVNESTMNGYANQYNQTMAMDGNIAAYNMMMQRMVMYNMMMQHGGNAMMQNHYGMTPGSNPMQNNMPGMMNISGTTPASNPIQDNKPGMQNFNSTPASNPMQNNMPSMQYFNSTPASNPMQNNSPGMMSISASTPASNPMQNNLRGMQNFNATPASNLMQNMPGIQNFNATPASNLMQNMPGMQNFDATTSNQNTMAGNQMQLNDSMQQQIMGMRPTQHSELNTSLANNMGTQLSMPYYTQNGQSQQFTALQESMSPGYYQQPNGMMPGSSPSTLQPQAMMASQPQVQQQSNNAFQQPANMGAYSLLLQNASNSGTGMQQQLQFMDQNPNVAAFTSQNFMNSGSQTQPPGSQGPFPNYGNFMATNLFPPQDNNRQG